MDLITWDDLKALTGRYPGWCVSILMPTHRAGQETQQDPIRLKNLVREVEERLKAKGLRSPEIAGLLEPAQLLLQHFIIDLGSILNHIFHFPPPDAILSFKGNAPFYPACRGFIEGLSQSKVIKHTGYGRTPVVYEVFTGFLIKKGMNTNINRDLFMIALFFEINSPKVWSVQ